MAPFRDFLMRVAPAGGEERTHSPLEGLFGSVVPNERASFAYMLALLSGGAPPQMPADAPDLSFPPRIDGSQQDARQPFVVRTRYALH